MNAANMRQFRVGNNQYAIDLLNPLEAITWGNRVMALLGPAIGNIVVSVDFETISGIDLRKMEMSEVFGKWQPVIATAMASCGAVRADDISRLMAEATQRCHTPRNEALSDAAVFNSWFRENPGDIYPVGVMAIYHLVKDFFPSQLVTVASRFAKMGQEMAGATQ